MAYEYITKYSSPNFSPGRPNGITGITIHWWDDPRRKPIFEEVIRHLCNPNLGKRRVSAHYVAEAGRVACLVDCKNRAWHAVSGNTTTIGIECNPRMSAGDLETVAELVANLRETYGNLPLYPHSHWVATDCPGTYKSKLQWLSDRANQILAARKAGKPAPAAKPAPAPAPAPAAKPAAPNIGQLASEVLAGKWGNNPARQQNLTKRYGASVYQQVQAEVNRRVGGTAKPAAPNIGQLATEVIAGKWGNNPGREAALTKSYGAAVYRQVQAEVNRRLR